LLNNAQVTRIDMQVSVESISKLERRMQVQVPAERVSKEIAERMKISPSTVKAFLRLVMVKMSVSTRSGIVGKVLGSRTDSVSSTLST